MIDGAPRTASYGLDRADYPTPPDCVTCKQTGFVADLSVAGLGPGPHSLAIRVIAADRESYAEADCGRFRIAR